MNNNQSTRSILDDPREGKPKSLVSDSDEALFTRPWRNRLVGLLRMLIPVHIDESRQIWVDSAESLEAFIDKLDCADCDFSGIEYVVIVDSITDIYDIVDFFSKLRFRLPDRARVIFTGYNFLWAPLFKLGAMLGLSRRRPELKFYLEADLNTFLEMAGWENVRRIHPYFLPVEVPVLSAVFDRFLIRLPLLRRLSLNTVFIARKGFGHAVEECSVSVLVPCKNEENNIEAVIKRIPEMGSFTEIVFINDKSTDGTEALIKDQQQLSPERRIVLVQGEGRGKGHAVRSGMAAVSGDICMILDADLTVTPEDLPQFYEAMKWRQADFIHGTRMVYPQEQDAMRYFNLLGNMGFAMIFSYILEQRTTDTLCGTKVFWRRDWPLFEDIRERLAEVDVWGDYDLIFGATFFSLKVTQIPVHYFERLEGETKMLKRVRNALIMLRVAWYALWRIKFMK